MAEGISENKETRDNYWQERAERVILASEKKAYLVSIETKEAYEHAIKEIQSEIERFYGRYAKETGLDITEIKKLLNKNELKTAKEDIATYYEEVKSRNYEYDPLYQAELRRYSARAYMSRLEELLVHTRHEIEKVYAKQYSAFKENLEYTYEDSYYHTVFDIQQGTGIASSFTALNTDMINKAVSTKWLDSNYSDRIWANKDRLIHSLNIIIPQGVALGRNPRIIAKNIERALGTSKNNATRLARTEFNHLTSQATFDAYEECGVDYYKYLATLDLRTSEICQELDSKVFAVRDKIVGVNCNPMHPNCRSTTVAYFEPDDIDAMFNDVRTRMARDPLTNENYFIPADMTYAEWKASLVEKHGEMILYKAKMDKYNQTDKKQFRDYRNYIKYAQKEHGKEIVSKLFKGFPENFEDFQLMKYTDRIVDENGEIIPKWDIYKENRKKLK